MLRPLGQGFVLRDGPGAELRMQVSAGERDTEHALPDSGVFSVEFRERLRGFVARRVSNRADVDDIVQRVFLQTHRSLGTIRNGARLHAWLYTTARRAVIDYYRSRALTRELPSGDARDLEDLLGLGDPRGGDDANGRAEVVACLAPLVSRLDAADREALQVVEVEGVRIAEAAARVGLSLPGMKSRVQRARRRLREALFACCRIAVDGRGMPMACAGRAAESTPSCGSRPC